MISWFQSLCFQTQLLRRYGAVQVRGAGGYRGAEGRGGADGLPLLLGPQDGQLRGGGVHERVHLRRLRSLRRLPVLNCDRSPPAIF